MHTKLCKALFQSSTVLIWTIIMVYTFTFALYHSFSTRQSERSFRKENLMTSPIFPIQSLRAIGSHWKYINMAYGNLHGLSFPQTWYHAPPFSFDSRHTSHCLTCKAYHAAVFLMQVFLSGQSSPPNSLLGLVNSYSSQLSSMAISLEKSSPISPTW